MKFWKDYKDAYDQIKANENSMEQILQKAEQNEKEEKNSILNLKAKLCRLYWKKFSYFFKRKSTVNNEEIQTNVGGQDMANISSKSIMKTWKNLCVCEKLKMKPVSIIIMFIVVLLLGINVPVFAKTILSSNNVISIGERIVALSDRILEKYGKDAYTQYNHWQRETDYYGVELEIENSMSYTVQDGVIMTLEDAFLFGKEVVFVVSFANEEGYDLINQDSGRVFTSSVKLISADGEEVSSRDYDYVRYDAETEKVYMEYKIRIDDELCDIQDWTFTLSGLSFDKSRREIPLQFNETGVQDLVQMKEEPKEKIVSLNDVYVKNGLVTVEGEKYPYSASVLDMTPWQECMKDDITITGMTYQDGILRMQCCFGFMPFGGARRSLGIYQLDEAGERISFNEEIDCLYWIEKINGENIEFREYYYAVTEDELAELNFYGDFFIQEGNLYTIWQVPLQIK